MPNYTVTSPDGRKFKVTAPDGATQEQVLAYAQSQFTKQSPQASARAAVEKSRADRLASGRQYAEGYEPGPPNIAAQVAGRTLRMGAQGLAALPLAISDAGVAVRNIMGGDYEYPSDTFGKALNQVAPAPQDVGGKVSEVIGSAALGSRYFPSVGIAKPAPAGYRPADPFQVPEEAVPQTAAPAANVPARSAADFGPVGADKSAGLSQAQKEIAERVKKLGMKLTPGQATGSRSLQQMEAKLESQPFSSGPFNTLKANNARAVNKSFLQAIGEKGDEVTEATIRNADDRIGRAFEVAAARNNVLYDDALQSSLAEIESSVSTEIGESGIGIIKAQLANILNKASVNSGYLTGRQYQNIRMALNRISKNQEVGYWARQIREQLDEALLRSVGPEDAARLTTARGQYRVLITAMNSNAVNTAKGAVSPGLLANAFSRSDKAGFIEGANQSNLYNALRFYKAFPSIVGDSGTATRAPFQGLTDLAMRIPAGVASRAYLSGPSVAAATGTQKAANRLGVGVNNAIGSTSPQFLNSLLLQLGK